MGFFRSLAAKLNGTYRKEWRDAIQEHLTDIFQLKKAMDRAGICDPRILSILDLRKKKYEKQEQFIKTAMWCGSPVARRLLKFSDEFDFYTVSCTLPMMRQYVDERLGAYDFSGVKLPLPRTEFHEKEIAFFFEDVIIYHLLEGIDPALVFRVIGNEGPYELNDKVCLTRHDVVFDCGANVGDFSAVAAAKGCSVYAFEPSRYIRETYLQKTAELNGGDFVICPYATSDRTESTAFLRPREALGMSRLDDGANKLGIGVEVEHEIVDAVLLDDFVEQHNIDRVDFIKADIEGAERRMLTGAKNILKKFSPKLSLCTYHLPDDPEVLADIILSTQPEYKIIQGPKKMYAYVDQVK